MGIGKLRNKLCKCGSGKKSKDCCFDSNLDEKNTNGGKINLLDELKTESDNDAVFNQLTTIENKGTDIERVWYMGLCNNYEIDRILSPQNTNDFLLKMRADTVVDHTRLYRVMLARQRRNERSWNFTNQFSDSEFKEYIQRLSPEDQQKCNSITRGLVFSDEATGKLSRSDFGDLVIISESLKYFFYYMNIFFLEFNQKIPGDVRFAALRIAIRVMLNTEALDFELDPRGIIPKEIHSMNEIFVRQQVHFVIGHEYGHYLLNHLDKGNLYSSPMLNCNNDNVIQREYTFYNHSQKQEFEADITSLIIPKYDEIEFDERVKSALYYFAYLELYEQAKEQIFPSISQIKTHPPALDRLWNVYNKTKDRIRIFDENYVDDLVKTTNEFKEILQEDISCHFEEYEVYGSVYLGSWRGKPLRDRIDY